jgi:hypothetical protein
MMKINGFNGTNTQTGAIGMAQTNDSVSKNIQNQIANAQQKLQDFFCKQNIAESNWYIECCKPGECNLYK